MPDEHSLQSLTDDELLRGLSELLRQSRRAESQLIAHIGEVDGRRLYAREAAPSMFAYCTEQLHLSEHEAYLRIAVARAAREHPVLLVLLGDGRLHLSGIAKLVPHLTPENRDALLERAAHKSKREVEELVAELAPRPDVPALVRRLPQPAKPLAASAPRATPAVPAGGDLRPEAASSVGLGLDRAPAASAAQLGPDRVAELPVPDRVALTPQRPAVVEALAPARYKVQFTASADLREKLERLQALLPGADLAQAVERAVTETLERLEARRFARTKAPRKDLAATDTTPSSRHVPAAVRRAVYERDAGRCTYADARGMRCSARVRLEFHHHERPYGRGGEHSIGNIRLMCREHNRLQAERDYGRDMIARHRSLPEHVSEPTGAYLTSPP